MRHYDKKEKRKKEEEEEKKIHPRLPYADRNKMWKTFKSKDCSYSISNMKHCFGHINKHAQVVYIVHVYI